MTVTIDLPDHIAQQLQEEGWQDLPRSVLESVALEAYRDEILSASDIGRLLGLSVDEQFAFLETHNPTLYWGEEETGQERLARERLLLDAQAAR
jgi:hypothetical protein